MRILLVSHLYPPRHRAGTEIYTANLARVFRERGNEVVVFTTAKDIARPDLSVRRRDHESIEVRELINNLCYGSFRETFANATIEARFAAVLDEFRPDVVHFMHLLYLSLGCANQVRERGIRAFYTMHDFWLQCARFGQRMQPDGTVCHEIDRAACSRCMARTRFAQSGTQRRLAGALSTIRRLTRLDLGGPARAADRWMRRRKASSSRSRMLDPAYVESLHDALQERERRIRDELVPAIERFYAPSRFLASELVRWGLPQERVEYLRVGIEVEKRPVARTSSESLRVTFVGTIAEHKGVHVLLDAWHSLQVRSAATLRLYGSLQFFPDYVAGIQERARALGVAVCGPFPRAELLRVLAETDVLVVPSIWYENSPLTILEALATDTPVIVSDLGGMSELVEEGVHGFRFAAGDSNALARVLERLIETPELLRELPGGAEVVVSVEQNADVLEAAYRGSAGAVS